MEFSIANTITPTSANIAVHILPIPMAPKNKQAHSFFNVYVMRAWNLVSPIP